MKATVLRSSCAFLMLLTLSVSYAAPIGVDQIKKQPSSDENAYAAPGIVVVMLKAGTPHTSTGTSLGIPALDRILARINTHKVNAFHKLKALYKGGNEANENSPAARLARMFKIEFGSPEESYALCAELAKIPEVEFAEPYYWFKPDYKPDDPMLSEQWAVGVMKLEEAWEITKGSSDVAIAIVDSGIDWDHADLAANIFINQGEWGTAGELSNNGQDDDGNGYVDDYHGWDFGNNDNDPDDRGIIIGGFTTYHGTAAAGCASAVADNGIGIAGAGYSCKLIPVKASSNGGGGITFGYEGIKYASDVGARVVSCSWGGNLRSLAYQAIIEYVNVNRTLVVTSSGNDPIDNDFSPMYPSSYPGVMAVGSVEKSGGISGWCTYGTTVDVYAPGKDIRTTSANSSYTTVTGTSFSSPYVAGVAGLVFSVHPDWTPQQVRKQIRVTARRGVTNDPKRYGRVDAEAAVSKNATLEDLPGLVIDGMTFPVKDSFLYVENAGETATFTVRFRNILAPTSANAAVRIEFDQEFLTTPTGWQTIGIVPNNGLVDVTFEVTISDTLRYSEDILHPFRIRFEDGNLVDFIPGSFQIYIKNGWHRKEWTFRPTYTSIDIVDKDVIWAASRQEPDGAPVDENAWVSTDGGETWIDANPGGPGTNGWPDVTSRSGIYCITGIDENTAIMGMPGNNISATYKTTNKGQSWASSPASAATPFINFIHMYDRDNGIYQGDPKNNKYGIGVTTDGGSSWKAIPNPVTAEAGEISYNNGYDAVGDHLWFVTNKRKIWRSVDRGMSWTSHPTRLLNSAGLSFRDEMVGVARFSKLDSTGATPNDDPGLELTMDGGITWTPLNTITINSGGAVEMEPGGKRMWVMNNYNSYVSDNLGQTWDIIPVPSVFILTCSDALSDESTGMSYVFGGGAYLYKYESPYQQILSVKPPLSAESFAINSVYPNPATAATSKGATVSFTLPGAGATTLQVYDYSGRLVATPVQATLNAGSQTAYVDFGSLPAGVYFLKLYHNNAVQVSKVTVMR